MPLKFASNLESSVSVHDQACSMEDGHMFKGHAYRIYFGNVTVTHNCPALF